MKNFLIRVKTKENENIYILFKYINLKLTVYIHICWVAGGAFKSF